MQRIVYWDIGAVQEQKDNDKRHDSFAKSLVIAVLKCCELDLGSSYVSAPCRTQTNIQIDVTRATINMLGLPEK